MANRSEMGTKCMNGQVNTVTSSKGDGRFVLNLKGRDWQNLDESDRDKAVEVCFEYWRARGLPYYRLTCGEIEREYYCLASAQKERILLGDEIQMSMVGMRIANYFHPQMWRVPVKGFRSPIEQFNNDEKLRKIIRKALSIWPDCCSVNENNLRRMLKSSYTTCVSNFRPTAAKAIYEHYSKDGDRVLDFSAGYGGRLLGCLPLRRHYLGVDPCSEQIAGLKKMVSRLRNIVPLRAKATLVHACAEDFMSELKARSFSLVFSSPPYFDNEKYCDEPSQSYLRYPTYAEWKEQFLWKVLSESWRVLKPGGFMVVNIADIYGINLANEALRLALKHFEFKTTLRLRLGHKPYLRAHAGEAYKYEPVFVFQKASSRSHG